MCARSRRHAVFQKGRHGAKGAITLLRAKRPLCQVRHYASFALERGAPTPSRATRGALGCYFDVPPTVRIAERESGWALRFPNGTRRPVKVERVLLRFEADGTALCEVAATLLPGTPAEA